MSEVDTVVMHDANVEAQSRLGQPQSIVPLSGNRGIVIVGGSGAGKTTLGGSVASILGLPFLDSDHLIELNSGDVIANIFAHHGEVGFRFLEALTIRQCVVNVTIPSIVTLGAGAWEDPSTRKIITDLGFTTIWLAESPAISWSRIAGDQYRPLATTYDQFVARWNRRAPAWSMATKVTPSKSPPRVLAEELSRTFGCL